MSEKRAEFTSLEPNPNFAGVNDVSPEEVREKLDQLHVVDVRRAEEFTGEFGHIPGARLMTLDQLDQFLDDLPKNETIVFICRSGNRSAQASAFARSSGFSDTYNMKGGMIAWTELNFEADDKNG